MSQLNIPESINDIDPSDWASFAPFFEAIEKRPLTNENVTQWLADWSKLARLFEESFSWAYIQKSRDTTDEKAEETFLKMINDVMPQATVADQALKMKLLQIDTAQLPDDMDIAVRNLKNETELFREENIPLATELETLGNEYDKITGSLSMMWDGEQKNLSQLAVFLQNKDRAIREKAWRGTMQLWQSERKSLNDLYAKMLSLRAKVAKNAGFADFRDYSFRQKARFDYTPEDCRTFHDAIEQVVVPAASRIYENRQKQLGVSTLRPWDMQVEIGDNEPLAPYKGQDALIQKSLNIFQKLDPQLAHYFGTMADDDLLDLETRNGKALGGYCSRLAMRQRPFIFMNGVGIHDDVQTLLHEAGHAFHDFESFRLPYIWQTEAPMEFSEVASMAMELLAAPYLKKENGGFYTETEYARARIEHLEGIITFLPYMAVVDAFQHWVYLNPDKASIAEKCDDQWALLWARFMKGANWQGFESEMRSGWHRKLHIFQVPFYYIEYGMAQVGALQVWRNSLTDQKKALEKYRYALSLGGIQSLPKLFEAAGAEFRFDSLMLQELVTLIEETITQLRY